MPPVRLALVLVVGVALAGCHVSTDRAATTPTPAPDGASVTTPSSLPASAARPTPSTSPTGSASYVWSSRRVSAADLPSSWRPGCPVAPAQLRLLTLDYVGFDGRRHSGPVVVNARAVSTVVSVFRSLYFHGFPIRSLRLVDDFAGSDDASMAADNTSAFNCRDAVGGSGWSQHAYGLAIDVNPRENPYVYGGQVLPPAGAAYTDRSPYRTGMAVPDGLLVRAFAARGWGWGGRWSSPDYQHFSSNGK